MFEEIIKMPITDREKIDKLLEIDAHLYTNLGIDSTKKERLEVQLIKYYPL